MPNIHDDLAVGIRFYHSPSTPQNFKDSQLATLSSSVLRAQRFASLVLVAHPLSTLLPSHVPSFPVHPYGDGGYVLPLNAMALEFKGKGYEYGLFLSKEVEIDKRTVERLLDMMDKDTLVSGVALAGHEFTESPSVPLNPLTIPWNTCAIWNLSYLTLTGFPTIASAPITSNGGMEEAATIALHQKLFPERKVKLVKFKDAGDIKWDGDDDWRMKHEGKMQSKMERGMNQLKDLGLEGVGNIMHIEIA